MNVPELKSILLAEDDPRDVELTMMAFAKCNLANDVVCVGDGAAALDYMYCRGEFSGRGAGNPAVIVLDIKMPKVDGIEVLRKLKSDDELKVIPVVILTSSREERDLLESYRLGVNGYVVKPLRLAEFVEAVSALGVFWALVNELPAGSRAAKGSFPHERTDRDLER